MTLIVFVKIQWKIFNKKKTLLTILLRCERSLFDEIHINVAYYVFNVFIDDIQKVILVAGFHIYFVHLGTAH